MVVQLRNGWTMVAIVGIQCHVRIILSRLYKVKVSKFVTDEIWRSLFATFSSYNQHIMYGYLQHSQEETTRIGKLKIKLHRERKQIRHGNTG